MSDLVAFHQLRDFLGLDGTAIEDYPELGMIRDSVGWAIESYLGRELLSAERSTSVRPTSRTRMIALDALPVSEVSSVAVEGDAVTSDDYGIRDYGIFMTVPVLPSETVAITYTGGYLTGEIPNPIRRAALVQIAYEWQGKDQIGAEMISTEGGTVSRPPLGLLKETKRLLMPFIHPLRIAG